MAREIERKFLVKNQDWKAFAKQSRHMAQGYLNDIQQPGSKSSIRIRLEDNEATINIKSLEIGLSRDEYEYPVDAEDAKKMLQTLAVGPVIEKVRYLVDVGQHTWEIDEFLGDNEGLIVAEVELSSEEDVLEVPQWIGHEVTNIVRYYNISLTQKPFTTWSEDEKNSFE